MDARELDMASQNAIQQQADEALAARVRKAWADNREDPDFTVKTCARRFGVNPARIGKILGPDAAKKATPSPWRER